VISVLAIYGLAGAAVLSVRVLLKEAREVVQPGHPDDGGIPQQGLAKLLAAVALVGSGLGAVGAVAIVADAPPGALDLADPMTLGSWFWPFSAVMDLFRLPVGSQEAIQSAVANIQVAPELNVVRAVVITAIELLLSAAMAVCACRLYRERRAQPESLAPGRSERIAVVAVGRDDWRGFGNPILTRELRTRLRRGDARMFINIAAIVSAAAALGPVLSSLGSSISPTVVAAMARDSFVSVSLVQLAIVCIFGPGVGAEVIAAEREHKTYEMLLASRLSASEILWGKVQGCVALLLLLISPALPLLALAAYLHGVTMVSVLAMIGVLG
ncbi:MAG: hypothetical protein LC772_12405, partial [Chloroflexi bacterium]|nr:hypothetical protein [Chloroflexota bacterium]